MAANEFWIEAVSEALEVEGVSANYEQTVAIASWMESACNCHIEYSSPPVEPQKPEAKAKAQPEQKQEWWRDTSQLCGSDWVLANQIHELINSRYKIRNY